MEWIRFVRVEHVPAAGEITHSTESWEQAGGGGAVAAIQLALLADEPISSLRSVTTSSATFPAELEERSVLVMRASTPATAMGLHAHRRCRRADDHDSRAEVACARSRREPSLARAGGMDAVLFIAGDVDALVAARRAPVLTATSREAESLRLAAVELDALIGSGEDEAERYHAGDLDPEPTLVVTTSGALGGWMQPGGPFVAASVPGARVDAYGCGDSFMAGITYALGAGLEAHDAVAFAARCGAAALTGRGVAADGFTLIAVTCQY